jgi:uncharacterized membrane protein YfcA
MSRRPAGTVPFVLTLALATVVVALACAVHGAVGFGMNLLAVPVLAILDPAFVPGPAVAAGLVLSVLMVVREPASIDPHLGWAVGGLVPGNALAVALLAAVPVTALAVPTGVLVLLAVVMSAVRFDITPNRSSMVVAGTASGFMATAAAIGGPPLALVYASSYGARLRSNLSAFFVVTGIVSVLVLTVSEHFGADAWKASAVLLPGVVAGFLISGPARRVVDRGHTRFAVLALSAVAGVVAIVQGLAAA